MNNANNMTTNTIANPTVNNKVPVLTRFKKLSVVSLLITATALTASGAQAARNKTTQALVEGGAITTTAIAGAAAGGPAGFVIGGLVGMFFASETRANTQGQLALEQARADQEASLQAIADLNEEMIHKERTISQLEQHSIDKLVFQVLFSTGKDALNEQDLSRLEVLAKHLINNAELHANLTGHADPRGSDEYNNILAIERAQAVKKALVVFGVNENRIYTAGEGSRLSSAEKGQYQKFATDRRVDIEITKEVAAPVAILDNIHTF